MKLWTWEHGRQGGGYSKFTILFSRTLNLDMYLLRLPMGSMVQHHVDPAPLGYEHHRVNITLRSAQKGGVTYFEMPNERPVRAPKHYHFRPDIVRHFVTPIMKGKILMLSIGWLRKAK